MAMITNDWLPAVREEFAKPYYRQLYQFVKEEYSRTVVYPPAEDIFNALHFTPLSEVKVLILGQGRITMNIRHMVFRFLSFRIRKKFRHLCRIFIKNCRMIWGVKFQTTAI